MTTEDMIIEKYANEKWERDKWKHETDVQIQIRIYVHTVQMCGT